MEKAHRHDREGHDVARVVEQTAPEKQLVPGRTTRVKELELAELTAPDISIAIERAARVAESLRSVLALRDAKFAIEAAPAAREMADLLRYYIASLPVKLRAQWHVPLVAALDALTAVMARAPRITRSAIDAARLGDWSKWDAELGTGELLQPTTDIVAEIAARGLTGPSRSFPFLSQIQRSFGTHDVSSLRAHVGGAAAEAADRLGAKAYAHGGAVAFAAEPDLHTAAHEAAHFIQQRAGVTPSGQLDTGNDELEQHADDVANAVLHGVSAQSLLDRVAGHGASSGKATVVQRKAASAVRPAADTTLVAKDISDESTPKSELKPGSKWSVFAKTNKPYVIERHGGKPSFWVMRDWIVAADDLTREGAAMKAPSRAHELLVAMGWGARQRIDFAANSLTFTFQSAISHFEIGADAAMSTGLPGGIPAIVERDAQDALQITLAIDDQTRPPGENHTLTQSEAQRLLNAVAAFTGLRTTKDGRASLLASVTSSINGQGWMWQTGNGVVRVSLNYTGCAILFGATAYDSWLTRKTELASTADNTTAHTAPKAKLENYYQAKIPGTFGRSANLVEASEAIRFEVQVNWPDVVPDPHLFDLPERIVTEESRDTSVLNCWWMFTRVDGPTPGAMEMKFTTLAAVKHRFRLFPGEAQGRFRVTCFARTDSYYEPTTFTMPDFIVMSTTAAMTSLQSAAFTDLGAEKSDRTSAQWHGDAKAGFQASPPVGATTPTDAAQSSAMHQDRARELEWLKITANYLRDKPESATAVAAMDREIERQAASEKKVVDDQRKHQQFQIRGTFLSRTEGVSSGPLELYGTAHIERLAVVDRVTVCIHDVSRRFEQEDFEFMGQAPNFDEALHQAFEDLADAYPHGRVSIEAEQIRGQALATEDGPGALFLLGPTTGKTVGFQATTDSTWKSVKHHVWDNAWVTNGVNAIAILAIAAFPPSAVVLAPALVLFNSVPAVDRLRTASAQGTLTPGVFAMSSGEIVLNLLPFLGEAKPFTAGWFALKTANWGGQTALMTAGAVAAARQIQATRVVALAKQYERYAALKQSGLIAGSAFEAAERATHTQVMELDTVLMTQLADQVVNNAIVIVANEAISHGVTSVREWMQARSASRAPVPPTASTPSEQLSSETPPTRTSAPETAAPHETSGAEHDGSDSSRTTKSSEPPKEPPQSTPGGGDGARKPRPSQIASSTEVSAAEQALVEGAFLDKVELEKHPQGPHVVVADEFHTEQQADRARWMTHGLEEHPEGKKLLADPTFRYWYEKWVALPDIVTVNANGKLDVRLPAGVPESIRKKILAVVENGNIGVTARAEATQQRIATELHGKSIDPSAPDWQTTRAKLVEIVGEAAVSKYEAEKLERTSGRAAERSIIDERLAVEVGDENLEMLRALYPGTEIYITGSGAQPTKARAALEKRTQAAKTDTPAPLEDLDIIVVVPDSTPQEIRIELEKRLNRLTLKRPVASLDEMTHREPLPVDGKVMTASEFEGYSMMPSPDVRTPLASARIDTWNGEAVPGTGSTGADLHNHGLGVPDVDYYIAKIGNGNAIDVLEKAWILVQEHPQITSTTKAAIANGIADVRNAKLANMPETAQQARARKALELALSAEPHEMPFDHTYDLRDELVQKHIDPISAHNPNGEFQNFAKDLITTLADHGTTYSEQSMSIKKLDTRFSESTMAKAHERAKLQGRDSVVKFLAMLSSEKTLSGKHGQTELPPAIVEDLTRIMERDDVKGVDFAGPEKQLFTPEGMNQLKQVYGLLEAAAKARNERLTLRPHVGEGYDPEGKGTHVEVARQNLEMVVTALEQLGYQPNGWVVVRFGHATHATDVQLGRIARLGVVIEANVGSNLATGSIVDVEEHPIMRAAYFDATTVLATDGEGVMHTTLPDEYRRAGEMFAMLKSGAITLKVGDKTVTWKSLSGEQQARFTVAWLDKNITNYLKLAYSTPSETKEVR